MSSNKRGGFGPGFLGYITLTTKTIPTDIHSSHGSLTHSTDFPPSSITSIISISSHRSLIIPTDFLSSPQLALSLSPLTIYPLHRVNWSWLGCDHADLR